MSSGSLMPSSAGASLLSFNESLQSSELANRADSVDAETEMAAWFVCGMPRSEVRQMATEMARDGVAGNFLIRDVKSEPNSYGLTVRTEGGKLTNYIVDKTKSKPSQYFLRGTKTQFATLSQLVNFYAEELRPALGIKLIPPAFDDYLDVDGPNPGASTPEEAQTIEIDDDDIDPEKTPMPARKAVTPMVTGPMQYSNYPPANNPYPPHGYGYAPAYPPYGYMPPVPQQPQPPPEKKKKKKKKNKKKTHKHRRHRRHRSDDSDYTNSTVSSRTSADLRLRAAEAQLELIRQETELAQARLRAAELALTQKKEKPSNSTMPWIQQLQGKNPHSPQLSRKESDDSFAGVTRTPHIVSTGQSMHISTWEEEQARQAQLHRQKLESEQAKLAQLRKLEEEQRRQAELKAEKERRLAELEARAQNALAEEANRDARVAEMMKAQAQSRSHSRQNSEADILLSTSPAFLSSPATPNPGSRPPSDDVDGMLEHAIRKEQMKLESKRSQVMYSANQDIARNPAPAKQKQRKVSFADEQEDEVTELPASDNLEDLSEDMRERLTSFRLDRTLFEKENKKLMKMEEAEMRRRHEFDERHKVEFAKAQKLSGTRYHKEVARLHEEELEEKRKRQEWDDDKEEREVRVLMNRPEGTKELEEYLEEETRRHRAKDELKKKRETELRDMVGAGSVKKFADKFR